MKTIKYLLSICTIILLSIISFAQDTNLDELMRSRNEYYFSVTLNNKKDAQAINKIVSVDKVIGNSAICYANNSQYDKLIEAGYTTTLLTPPSMLEDHRMFDGTRATYDWNSYPTYSAYEQMMNEYNAYNNCEVLTLGTLSSGRKIMVAHINNGQSAGKPKFLYSSTMHGDETTGWIMMLRLIDVLLTSNDTRVQNLVDSLDIYICPLANPDGTYHGGNNTVNGATRANGNGVDLNRNYPDFDDGAHPDGLSYQNETQWFMQLAQNHIFTMSANYHGGAEVVNYPWDTYQQVHVDDAWWQLVSRKYATSCQNVNSNYTTAEDNGITNGYAWYTISGSRQDYMNYYAECREVTIECSDTKCPSGNQLPNFWNYSYDAILGYMEDCLDGIHGIVTDSQTGQPIQGVKVKVLNHDNDNYSTVTSHEAGDYHRVIKGGTYTVQYSKAGYCTERRNVTIADGQRINLDIQLTPGDCLIADFTANRTAISAGQTVSFTDISEGSSINSRSWQFEGGSPATSTQQNPTITYNTPGVYTVTLTVSNQSSSDTETKIGYINVVEQSINMSNTTINTCNSLFYDDNGPNESYDNNKSYTTVIYPDNSEATLQVVFYEFETENGYDFLYIYQGNTDNNSNLIGQYSGTSSPGTVTANTPGGALTFKFTSDAYVNGSGWKALIKCILPTEPITIQVTADPTTITQGQSSDLEAVATGGTGQYTYSWQPSSSLSNPSSAITTATPTQTTTYTVTVNDGVSSETATVTVTVLEALNVTATANPSTIILGQSSQLTVNAQGGTGQYTYSWQPSSSLSNPSSATPTATPTQTTTYTVTVNDGISSGTATVTVTVTPDGIADNATFSNKIYPNPAKDEICIENSYNGTCIYRIFNGIGQLVCTGSFNGKAIVGTEQLGKGLFLIEVCNDSNVSTHKIIVQ